MANQFDQIKHSLGGYQQITDYPKFEQNIIQSAILIPMVMDSCELSLVFTRRSDNLARHAGQVSFPGGMREPGDQSPVDTAVRETQEEIGLTPDRIEIIGMMNPYNSSTGFCVFPVVGLIHGTHGLMRNNEVEKLFFVPTAWLDDPRNSYQSDYHAADRQFYKLWYFNNYEGEIIWGLTAQITKDFLNIVKKEQ